MSQNISVEEDFAKRKGKVHLLYFWKMSHEGFLRSKTRTGLIIRDKESLGPIVDQFGGHEPLRWLLVRGP